MKIRCSSLDRIAACPAAAKAPEVVIDFDSEPARMGNAVDDFLTSDMEAPVAELAATYRLDVDDVRRACGAAAAAWNSVKDSIPDPWFHPGLPAFQDSRGVILTGTPDLISLDGGTLYVLDFKSGWGDGNHFEQVTGYAKLAMAYFGTVKNVVLMILHTRLGVIDRRDLTAQEVNDWWDVFVSKLLAEPDRHSPSPASCTYCPRAHECKARTTMLTLAIEVTQRLIDQPASITEISPDGLAAIINRCRIIEAACEQARAAVKVAVANAGGVLPIGGDRELAITHVERKEIDFQSAEPFLEAHVGGHWRKAVQVSKTKLEKIVGDLAPKRGKGKAIKALMDDLEQADAIKITTTERLEVRKAAKALPLVEISQ